MIGSSQGGGGWESSKCYSNAAHCRVFCLYVCLLTVREQCFFVYWIVYEPLSRSSVHCSVMFDHRVILSILLCLRTVHECSEQFMLSCLSKFDPQKGVSKLCISLNAIMQTSSVSLQQYLSNLPCVKCNTNSDVTRNGLLCDVT